MLGPAITEPTYVMCLPAATAFLKSSTRYALWSDVPRPNVMESPSGRILHGMPFVGQGLYCPAPPAAPAPPPATPAPAAPAAPAAPPIPAVPAAPAAPPLPAVPTTPPAPVM